MQSLKRLFLCTLLLALLGVNQAYAQVEVVTTATPTQAELAAAKFDSNVLETSKKLLRSGALQLALAHLKQNQPSLLSISAFQAWAEQKWSVFILLEDWQALKQDIPKSLRSFKGPKQFSISYQARAMIALGEFDKARRLLQPALIAQDMPLRVQKEIRAQLIALYQAQGDFTNAKIEAVRFHDSFKPQQTSWFITRAVIEYLSGDAQAASKLLAASAVIESKLLQTLFRFESNKIDYSQANSLISKQLKRKRITAQERKLAYGIQIKIARSEEASVLAQRLAAFEHYFVIDQVDLHPEVVNYNSDEFINAYLALSKAIVNQVKLEPGRSGLKFTLAQQRHESDAIIESRAIYIDVLLADKNTPLFNAAKNKLVDGIIDEKEFKLLALLFGKKNVLSDFTDINSAASVKILNYALEEGDADLISAIAPHLKQAPENVSEQGWLLQKARIDVFAGRFDKGAEKIIKWLSNSDLLTGEAVDRVLQPIFDLQAVLQDELSLSLLDKVSAQTNSARHKREILFWKAQSYEAMEDRIIAAQYYLRSALEKDNGYDQWGHSARYHAASNLMEAGNYSDARALFNGLLKATIDASRRGTIKQALQRLWLLENNPA